ncbi:ribosomal protein S18-alanine N-acetyltransferase [Vagococcus coleopterorum]|uniref:[Ribosomal protein bS18]-alanine N-acetyltransferase n=1 Tax=Vagococcus coleopterorum TaxID=2714946 RepID=A0A6G8AMT6_9ENTE|nr:ribosomal protein S18-alanine N-acetyltransferase [Vagococcus coleopterorum]QIL46394.1 ribosomal protein S18-alanine N-acetyltransferase [Vagococcus coleopterorum]
MSTEQSSCESLARGLWQLADASYDFGSPWTAEQFFDDLSNERSNYLTRLEGNQVIGFISYRQMLDEIEIDNIAVSPKMKGCGTAQSLMEELVDIAKENKVVSVYLEVRSLNEAAVKFYKKNKFIKVGKRKGYYHGPDDDGILMVRPVR